MPQNFQQQTSQESNLETNPSIGSPQPMTTGVDPYLPRETNRPRGRLLAYARWQLFDFFRDRSLAIVLVGVLLGFPMIATLRLMQGASGGQAVFFPNNAVDSVIAGVVAQLIPIFILITINKIVSGDRANGYYRFLFAKPISVRQYYTQSFVVHGAGMLMCVALLCSAAYFAKVSLPIGMLVLVFAITYVTMGSIGYLLSVWTRFDWQGMLVIWFGSLFLQKKYEGVGGIAETLVHLLPPANLSYDITSSLISGEGIVGSDIRWFLGYGLVCFAAAVVGLRYRQLAS